MSYLLRDLGDAEVLAVFEEARFGHLACCQNNRPYVVPVYFAFEKGVAYSFTMPGRKLTCMRENPHVVLQVDHKTAGGWTSVILEGTFEEFPDNDVWRKERLHAWQLLQKHSDWWEIGALKPDADPARADLSSVFYGIFMRQISGRAAALEV